MRCDQVNIQQVLSCFPKERPVLSPQYAEIYERHFTENRLGLTKVSKFSSKFEGWLHKKVAETAIYGSTLEIGGGSLNQFRYERKMGIYDVVEPYHKIYEHSEYTNLVDSFYDDISDVYAEKQGKGAMIGLCL